MKYDLHHIAGQFDIPDRFVSIEPHGTGHIHDTFVAAFDRNGARTRYIIQRINHHVFKNPAAVMENILRVTSHQRAKLIEAGCVDVDRRVLTIIPAQDGAPCYRDDTGNTWRAYLFIERAKTCDVVENPKSARGGNPSCSAGCPHPANSISTHEDMRRYNVSANVCHASTELFAQAYQAARAFGEFQKQLTDLPGNRLHETIPDFHNTPKRFEALERAIAENRLNRAVAAKREIEFALKHKDIAGVLLREHAEGRIPERIVHNDTKLNNVMFDEDTNEALCVIDLDTAMPGLALCDFGDIVRSASNAAGESEKDLSKVHMQLPVFEAIVKGYMESAGQFLTETERKYLAFSAKLITLETGIRFLADYLDGDVYFKVRSPEQNLDRCRTQFKLVQSIIEQDDAVNRIVESVCHTDS